MTELDFDHNATTPLDPAVADAMAEVLACANPSSVHAAGRRARSALDEARASVAAVIGVPEDGVVFCGSATEANNLAVAGHFADFAGHLVVSAIEHPSVGAVADHLEERGVEIARVAPGPDGVVAADAVLEAVVPGRTRLVSLMAANNVTGAVQPVAEVAAGLPPGVLLHSDAAQAPGRIPLGPLRCAHLLTLSAHKMHGPAGVGCLAVQEGAEPAPVLHGGGQEGGLRPGTEFLPGIVGLAAALEAATQRQERDAPRMAALSTDLRERILEAAPAARFPCPPGSCLPNTVSASFAGVDGRELLLALDAAGVCISGGSACASGSVEPAPALLAMGMGPSEALATIRFSLGRATRSADVEELGRKLAGLRLL